MPSLLTLLLPLPLALAAALTTVPAARRLGWLGALAYALGAASVRVALRLPLGETADPVWIGAFPITSLRIDAGLQLLGAMLALGSGARAAARGRRARDRWAAVLAPGAAIAIIVAGAPLFRVVGWLPSLAAGVALGAAVGVGGALLVGAVTRLARFAQRSAPQDRTAPLSPAGRSSLLVLLGAIAALFAPHLDLVLAGAAVASVAAFAIRRRQGAGSIPIFPAAVVGALGFAGYYLHVIAGPGGLWLASLPDAPLSAAAQALILPALAVAAIGFFGFWPLHRLTPGAWLAPIGVALLLRIGAESLPLGIDGWRTVTIPIGVVAAWAAAIARRPLLLASAGAWMACFAPGAGGAAGAWLLALVPLAGVGLGRAANRSREDRGLGVHACAVALIGALGATLALDGLLRAEVVYAVLSACAAAFSAVYISRART